MIENPLIRRYRFSQFRPQQLMVFGILYAGVLFLLFFINLSIYTNADSFMSQQDLYQNLFIQFAIMQILLMWLLMPMSCSNAIQKEIADKSFDFFRMLPVSAYQKATGILIGRNLFSLIIAGINLIFGVVFAILAGVSSQLLIQLLFLAVCVSLAMNFASLLSSILSYKNAKSNAIALVLLAVFGFGPIIGGLIESIDGGPLQVFKVYFFNIQVPVLYLISAYVLIIAGWFFVGILRRFTFEYQSLCSRKGAIFLMLTYLFLVYGILHRFIFSESPLGDFSREEYYGVFYVIGLLPLGLIPVFSIRTFDQYIELTRTSQNRTGLVGRQFLNSNVMLGLVLFGMWAFTMTVLGVIAEISMIKTAMLTVLLLVCYLIVVCFVEIYALYSPGNGKIGYLLGFIAGMYLILPLICSGLFENQYIAMFSPIGLIFNFSDESNQIALIPIMAWNMVVLFPLALLVGRQYVKIAQVRSAIEYSNHGAS